MIYGYKKKKLIALIVSTIVLCSLLLISISFNKVQGISMADRINGFTELTEVVEENYLPLDIYTRSYDDLKDVTMKRLKEGTENIEYTVALFFYLDSFSQWKTRLLNHDLLAYYHTMIELEAKTDNPLLEDILNSTAVQQRNSLYFGDYSQIEKDYKWSVSDKDPSRVYKITDTVPGEIAYLKFFTFDLSDGEIEFYKNELMNDLKLYENYDKIIIDIRGTTGYEDKFWEEAIVPLLASEDVKAESYSLFKGELSKAYYEKLGYETEVINSENISLYKAAEELSAPYVLKDSKVIKSSENHILFDQIYFVVDHTAQGAASNFAEFINQSDFGTLVGLPTRPRQITYEPMFYELPNGYVVSLEVLMPITSDHQLNFYYGTNPDFTVEYPNAVVGSVDKAIQFVIDQP